VAAQAGEEGRLFGSVTAMQVAELLAAKGFEIDRRRIDLAEPIKQLGDHVVNVKLHRDVVAKVRLKVTASE
jgi:large subunit ribosomal protein L9